MPPFAVIPLALFEDGQTFESLEDLLLRVNEHADSRGYAVVLGRTKKSKLKVTRKAWVICDRGTKIREPQGQDRRHTSSRALKCPFLVIGKRLDNNTGPWQLDVVNGAHNHEFSLAGAHSVLRRIAMTDEIKSEIARALIIQTASAKIISGLRIADPTTGMNDNFEDSQPINLMFKKRDILNLKAQMRRDELGPLTPIQALIKELDGGD